MDVGRMSMAMSQIQPQQQASELMQQHQLVQEATQPEGRAAAVSTASGLNNQQQEHQHEQQEQQIMQQLIDQQQRSVQPYLGGIIDVRI